MLPKLKKGTPGNAEFSSISSACISEKASLAKMINRETVLLEWKGLSDELFLQKEGGKNHVKRNSGSSLCIVCLYYSFYQIVNLCNSIIGDIVEFLTVYTFKFIYVMFYQLQSEFLRSMLTFAIKMQYGMVHNWKKRKEKR